jgi:Family of unknown function (DUF6011)
MTRISWPWYGEIVAVDEDRSWFFYRCVSCRRPLTDERSQELGFGSNCARKHGAEKLARRVWAVRIEDRRRFANRLDVLEILSRPGRTEDDGPQNYVERSTGFGRWT